MKISIIIPVYNAEKYLKRCLNSVIESLGKIEGEILIIDNKSTDNSLILMKAYLKKYPKLIKLFDCTTPGAAAVRNFGAKKARGDYIWFVDADDEITKDSIGKLVECADKIKADLVMFGMERRYPDGKKIIYPPLNQLKKILKVDL